MCLCNKNHISIIWYKSYYVLFTPQNSEVSSAGQYTLYFRKQCALLQMTPMLENKKKKNACQRRSHGFNVVV